MKKTEIYKIFGKDYKAMTKALLAETDLKSHIKKGARIGIKPNLVAPTPAEFGATTHPEVVAGIIEYLQEQGFSDMTIIEGSWIGDSTEDSFEYCGYSDLSRQYNVPLVDAQKEGYHSVDCAGMDINIVDAVSQIDFMINVPVLKGHGQTRMTCALKNMKGLIPNSEKRLFHRQGIHRPVAHLSAGIHQDFIVVDHICGDLELEDGGNPIVTDCIMAGFDPVLMDAYCCRLLGFEYTDVEYIKIAAELGLGSTDLSSATVINCGHSSHPADTDDDLEPFRNCQDRLFDIRINVEDDDSCSACYGALMPALLSLKEEGRLEEFMKLIGGKISIGQGNRGRSGCFGIGNCCSNFDHNIAGCPPKEEDILKEFERIWNQH